MQGIEFDDEGNTSGLSARTPQIPTGKPSPIFNLLNKLGVTDKSTANLILLVVALLLFSFAGYLYAGILKENKPSKQDVEQMAEHIKIMQAMQNIK